MKCTICNHPQIEDINQNIITGVPQRVIAKRYGVSDSSVHRHKKHLPSSLTTAAEAERATQADNLLLEVEGLLNRSKDVLDRAEQAGDLPTALKAIREARQCLELLAKLEGQLWERSMVDVRGIHWVEHKTDEIAMRVIHDPEASELAHQLLERIATGGNLERTMAER